MRTTVTHRRNEPAAITLGDMPANSYAIMVDRTSSRTGELIYRGAADNYYVVSRPGHGYVPSTFLYVRPITKPVSVAFGPTGAGSIDTVAADSEPEPIPMSEMKPGDIGQITCADACVGDWAMCSEYSRDGKLLLTTLPTDTMLPLLLRRGSTVRLLQPGESLTIACLPDEVETPKAAAEPLTNAARLCVGCEHTRQDPDVLPCRDGCFGVDGHPHFTPKATAPQTLEHALMYGTVDEIVSVADVVDVTMSDAVRNVFGDVFDEVMFTVFGRGTILAQDWRDLATIIVSMRDKLRQKPTD